VGGSGTATIAEPEDLRASARRADAARNARFFTRLAAVLVALTFVAFSTTYLLPVSTGRFSGPPILHVHGVLFLAWPVLLLVQSLSIGRSRRLHRALGFCGISLATAMLITGLLAIGSSIESWTARGVGLEGQAISIIAFTGVLLFASLFVAAISATRDRATHARYMVLATLAIMQATSGRLALIAALQGNPDLLRPGLLPPQPVMIPAAAHLLFDVVFLTVLAVHDRRTLGKLHRATLFGGGAIVVVHATRHLFAGTPAWAAIAGWLTAL
jgi:hypothetical protein